MAIEAKTQIKTYFESGDRPTQAQFENLIDSAMRSAMVALANGIENDGITGLVYFKSSTSVTSQTLGTYGVQILTLETTAQLIDQINAETTFLTVVTGESDTAIAVSGGNFESRYLNGRSLVLSAQVSGDIIIAESTSVLGRIPRIASTARTFDGLTIFDINDVPSWATRIHIAITSLDFSGTPDIYMNLGNASAYISAGYHGVCQSPNNLSRNYQGNIILLANPGASDEAVIIAELVRLDLNGNRWSVHTVGGEQGDQPSYGGGCVDVSAPLTRFRITTQTGAIFDEGQIYVSYRPI